MIKELVHDLLGLNVTDNMILLCLVILAISLRKLLFKAAIICLIVIICIPLALIVAIKTRLSSIFEKPPTITHKEQIKEYIIYQDDKNIIH